MLFRSLKAFAADIRVAYVTAQVMKHRNSISPDYWPLMVSAAEKRGIKGVSYETLTKTRKPRRPLGRTRKLEPRVAA